ncbi:hypothetical protein CLU88_3069 [Acidovorax sp. 56]|uniref:DUF6883 domain-containing protein n=1 Tax=Acidovorax sp. 56 TaxID=2035205 RepID=UPI000C1657E3|nr:DUF6883 domain-containing protein [Acidovorax sp. 56]PIF28163.1 hypothetical protein CLU88_3069 [Acidovorax sp. 56]
MQVTSSGAAAVWDTPTIEPITPASVDAYDPGSVDTFDTVDTKPLLLDGGAGYDTGYNKPLLVDEAPVYETVSTKPLLITDDGNGDVAYGVNKPLQIDAAPEYVTVHTKPLLLTPAQVASPDAATAVAAPKASAMEIAALELLLAEPANQEMIAQFGPPLAPLNTGTDVGNGIQARFGTDLGARLTQLQEAQNNVRGQFLKALDEAQQHPGPNVVGSELVQLYSSNNDSGDVSEQTLLHVTHPIDVAQTKAVWDKANQFVSGVSNEWRFTDPAEFAKAYAAGDSPTQKAFALLHGKEPLQFQPEQIHNQTDAGVDSTPAHYKLGEAKLVMGGQTVDDNGNPGDWRDATLEKTQLTPEQNRRLINNEYLWFDPVNGWSTDLENNIRPSNSFIDKAFPLVFAGVMTMMTAGAFGITAASASTSLGQSMALGAISSANMQLATGGKINLGNMLRSALTAGVTFGVMDVSGVSGALQSTELATRTLGHLGKAGLQGLLQEASGGKFKDGLTNSLISSVAGEVGKSLESQITALSKDGTLNVQEASTLRLMSRAASSAVRVAGSGDAAAGFASDFLGGLMEENNPFAGKADAGGKADKTNKTENTGNTRQGDKPNNEWVQNLGSSDVDPTQAQGLQPGRSSQGLRVSGDALSNWSDEIDGGIRLNGSMAPEAPAINEAVVGKGQGPLAALAAAGLNAQEQRAAYGQLLASGQVRLNAQGVPVVQPGQVLRFDLSDTSAAQLGGRAIAAESGGRAQRDAAAENTNNAGGGRGFVNPAPASEYGNYPFAGRSTITDPSAYTDPRQRVMTLASMSDMPIDSFSAAEWRAAASEYKQIQGKDFSRDAIYNGLWTKAAALENAAGKGFSRDAINDITGFATEEGLHAQVGMAMGGALGRGIGNRLGGSVDNAMGAAGKTPDGNRPQNGSGVSGVEAASSRDISNNGGVELAEGASSLIGANRAVIDPRKLTDYALNPAHPVGGNKARVFESALGFTKSNADDLMSQLRQGVMNYTPIAGKVDQFGSRFTVDIPVTGPAGSGVVRSGWIYKPGSNVPEMTTIFVK